MEKPDRIRSLVIKHSKTSRKPSEGEVAYLSRISIMSLAYLNLKSLPFLKDFPSTRIIRANNNKLTSVELLKYNRLEVLDLSNNELNFETIPVESDNIREIDISCNKIGKLGEITSLPNLENLNISYQNIERPIDLDIGGIHMKLKYLDVSGCKITNLSFVQSLPFLGTLLAKDNNIKDKEELQYLSKLERLSDLDLRNNPISKSHTFFREVALCCDYLSSLNGKDIVGNQLEIARRLNERP